MTDEKTEFILADILRCCMIMISGKILEIKIRKPLKKNIVKYNRWHILPCYKMSKGYEQ